MSVIGSIFCGLFLGIVISGYIAMHQYEKGYADAWRDAIQRTLNG